MAERDLAAAIAEAVNDFSTLGSRQTENEKIQYATVLQKRAEQLGMSPEDVDEFAGRWIATKPYRPKPSELARVSDEPTRREAQVKRFGAKIANATTCYIFTVVGDGDAADHGLHALCNDLGDLNEWLVDNGWDEADMSLLPVGRYGTREQGRRRSMEARG